MTVSGSFCERRPRGRQITPATDLHPLNTDKISFPNPCKPVLIRDPLGLAVADAGGELAGVFFAAAGALIGGTAAWGRIWTTPFVAHLCG